MVTLVSAETWRSRHIGHARHRKAHLMPHLAPALTGEALYPEERKRSAGFKSDVILSEAQTVYYIYL
uniref:Uncharacterized protein n=1 Tax=Hyaloperonospora arabidopsidis (strain Emoy2) TaxID=559515 RepID=M4C1J9_HYAAE